ncbi:MAG TPA: hypothetical protein VFI65_01305 [Streptosporangiaceae bacterium]|nr:hypothetical protein [Streptosporangiaceae bacterium]
MLAVGLATAIFYSAAVLSFTGFRSARLMALWQWDIIAVTSLVLAVVAIWRLRRQALL